MKILIRYLLLLCAVVLTAACTTAEEQQAQADRDRMNAAIATEPQGDYFIGRRLYKKDYKFWGFVRAPGQLWPTAKLVMFNEKQKLAPDRAANKIGSDNGFEYKLYGHFSNDTVYEPASNGFYPEFVLTGYELLNEHPAPIFHTAAATDPVTDVVGTPY